MSLDHTHDPTRRSWVTSATSHPEFPIQNLPYGVFERGSDLHIGVAIGDEILDLTVLEQLGYVPELPVPVFAAGELNAFMALGPEQWRYVRHAVFDVLQDGSPPPDAQVLVPQADARMQLPFFVRSFTDFYASRSHANNVGTMFRGPEKALMPNWLHLPVGYNGRASGVVVSGTEVRRPRGQILPDGASAPVFAPSARLDMELELGAVVGMGTLPGQSLSPEEADRSIFGYVLLNDWSARDLQLWEYQPLGPFLSKAFATTISPWVVTRDALAPFRALMPERDRTLLPYLASDAPLGLDVALEATLTPQNGAPVDLCRTNAKYLYYAPAQMLTHLSSSGAPVSSGDLLGSGTISGSDPESLGSLLEITQNGRAPLALPGGQARTFLEDGDTIRLSGACDGAYRIGFGVCEGRIHPAPVD